MPTLHTGRWALGTDNEVKQFCHATRHGSQHVVDNRAQDEAPESAPTMLDAMTSTDAMCP